MTSNPIGRARESIREAAYAYPQSVKDARSDAETFRLFCMEYGGDALNADWHGRSALYWMECEGIYDQEWLLEVIAERAVDAARAAFRAVPGLRDEDPA